MSDKHRNFRWAWINSIRRLKLILNVAQRLESHHCVTEILVKPRAHRRPEAQRSTSTAEQQRGEIKESDPLISLISTLMMALNRLYMLDTKRCLTFELRDRTPQAAGPSERSERLERDVRHLMYPMSVEIR